MRQNGNNDEIMQYMKKIGIPVNRKNYLDFIYPDGLPEDYGAENEMELPEELRVAL